MRRFFRELDAKYIYSYIVALSVVIMSFTVYRCDGFAYYKTLAENQYNRSFSNFASQIADIDRELKMYAVALDCARVTAISNDIRHKAASARAELTALPSLDAPLVNTSAFLVNLEKFALLLSKKTDPVFSESEAKKLSDFSKYTSALNLALDKTRSEITMAGGGSFSLSGNSIAVFARENGYNGALTAMDDQLIDYPFYFPAQSPVPPLLQDKDEITVSEASYALGKFLGADKIVKIELINEGYGDVAAYSFNVLTNEDGAAINADVTKRSGYVVWMLCNKQPKNANINQADAVTAAESFLTSRGVANMEMIACERAGNALYVDFAYSQDGVIIYADRIKVKVSLDDGEIIGFFGGEYINNHTERRTMEKIEVSPTAALIKAQAVISVESQRLCVIDSDTSAQVLCYEFTGAAGDTLYKIYINAQNGVQERIVMLY